jgi:hypothetical protein
MTLTTVLDSCGHETSGWPQLYETDPDFATTYQMLGAKAVVDNFHLQDGLLCHLGHISVPSSKRANPTTARWQDTLASKRQWRCYKNISIGRNFNRRSASISGLALLAMLPNQPLQNRACTPLFLLLTDHGNPSQWTTCRASLI